MIERTKALGRHGATRSYNFRSMPATDAWEVIKILGPGLVGLMLGIRAGAVSAQDAMLLTNTLRSLPSKDFDTVRDLLLKSCALGGKSIDNFDAAFTGRMFELFEVLKEALQVNFADFLDAVKPPSSPSAEAA